MARAPSYSMGKQRNVPSPYTRESRPSAFDRFPGKARNEWINEMRAKIDGTLNPPSPPGPSRSPSPIEEDVTELGVAQSAEDLGLSDDEEEDELDEEDEGYVSGEQEEDGSYDEDYDHDNLEDENPLGLGRQLEGQQSEDGFYEDEEDEGIENEEEDDSHQPQLAFPTRRNLEDEDPSTQNIDPRLVNQFEAEGEFDEESEDQGSEEDDEMEGEDQEAEEDAEKENSITYIGDTDEEEVSDSEDEEEDARGEEEYTEDEEDLEEEEIDDDGMGGPDALPLESEGLENQGTYEAVAPVGVEHGQVVYDYRTSSAELDYLRDTQSGLENAPASYVDMATGFMNPNQLPATGNPEASGSGSNLYPSLPDFNNTPGFTPASQMIPPWEPSPLDPAAVAAEEMDNALIDPSLLADFAQRVEAQVSGDLGSTTEAQNTEEMTALADAVMGQYNDTPDQTLVMDSAPQLEDVEVVQFGMGEAENEGYEEDDGSRATSEDVDAQGQSEGSQLVDEAVSTDHAEEDDNEEESDSESPDESLSAAASPAVNSTRDDPIEILSSDEEDDNRHELDDKEDEEVEDEEQDDEDEEEEEVEPTRPAGLHTHFEHDMTDILTPPHSASRSGRTPVTSHPESPTVRLTDSIAVPEVNTSEEVEATESQEDEELQEKPEENEDAEQNLQGGYPFSPMAVIDSELPITEEGIPESQGPVDSSSQAPEEVVIETTEEVEVEQPYEPEVEEPASRGPSVPLVTPAVELPLDTVFPTIPEAGLEAIMRVFEQPDVVEEAIEVEGDGMELEGDVQVEVTELEDEPEVVDNEPEFAEDEPEVRGPEENFIDVVAETASADASASEEQEAVEGSEATPSPLDQTAIPVSATDYATIETNTQALPDPHEAPAETELAMPDVPFHRSRTPSLIVEPPANPPNPDIVVDAPLEEPIQSAEDDLPNPQDPIPDTHIVAPLSPHDMRPTLERSPSLFVNIQEVEMMLDPGPNEAREESPVNFPEHDQPAPPTDVEAPIEPEDLEPRDEPRSVSMEALAPGQAPLEEMTGAADMQEDEGVLFPESGDAAPDTLIPSPLDVRRDLPLDTEGSEIAPSLIVEPPSEPATGPPSLTGTDEEASNLLDVPEIVVDEEEEDEMEVPTSSNIDIPSAPLRATTPTNAAGPSSLRATTPSNEAGPSETQHIRFASPLRHHHGHVPRHTSVPPPATRVTRRHTRQSSAAIDAISPPVTRQNCHYRKLFMAEGDMSATVLVPQCTLTDHEKLREEHSEDRGDATPADEAEARHQPICEATPRLQTVLTAKLHRIVGSDIFDEAQKTYLLSASDAALLPHVEDDDASASTSAPASVSPIKSRRKSKRLSEAPSETSIAEEPTKHKRSVSVAHTASTVPEETEADTEGRYELRSRSDVPASNDNDDNEIEAEATVKDADDTEVKTDDETTVSPTSTTQPTSKRYSLRSQPEIPTEDEIATESRATTPIATDPTPTQVTPMTTRRRARESISAAPQSSGGQSIKIEDEIEAKEPSTPRAKGKGKSKSPKKGKRNTDSKYIYSGDEEDIESDQEAKGDKEAVKEEETDRESSAEIIPYKIEGTSSSGTGRKKRKLGSSVGLHNSPWQLGTQDVESEGTPSRRSKKRAVESKDGSDVPTPVDVGDAKEEEKADGGEELPPLPQPKGWMSYIWPFKR